MMYFMKRILLLLLLSIISACSGGSSDGGGSTPITPPPPTPPPTGTKLTEQQAAAFLNRGTFGASRASVDQLVSSTVEDWFQQQKNANFSLLRPYLATLPDQENIRPPHRIRGWWVNVVHGDDQLRQRVAFALSEIFVTSDQNSFLAKNQYAMADYYDLLVTYAFGNYRELLEKVTLSPVMGSYLSMLGNQKGDVANNIRPDENYAREVMQLFTIGLVELNADGTSRLDSINEQIPTYNQQTIESFARVFTGWTFGNSRRFQRPSFDMDVPMEPWQDYHDTGSKTLLNDVIIPAGQTATQDLEMALDNLFNHPNVGPFISRQLIQRLVTSNPSPAYISRVASIFNDDGSGVRGDLGAVIVAILTDDEAMTGYQQNPTSFGKLREPLIRTAHFWRIFNASTLNGTLPWGWVEYLYGQAPLRAHHVFNFFSPSYQPSGEIADANLVAPEFEIATANNLTGMHNISVYQSIGSFDGQNPKPNEDIILQTSDFESIANDHNALLDELDLLFTAGQLTAELKSELLNYLSLFPASGAERSKVLETAFLIMSSNQYAIQK